VFDGYATGGVGGTRGECKRETRKGSATIVERPAAPATSHHGYHYHAGTNTVTGGRPPPSSGLYAPDGDGHSLTCA